MAIINTELPDAARTRPNPLSDIGLQQNVQATVEAIKGQHQEFMAAVNAISDNNAAFRNAGLYGMGSPKAEKSSLRDMLKVFQAAESHHESHHELPAIASKKSVGLPSR